MANADCGRIVGNREVDFRFARDPRIDLLNRESLGCPRLLLGILLGGRMISRSTVPHLLPILLTALIGVAQEPSDHSTVHQTTRTRVVLLGTGTPGRTLIVPAPRLQLL